jgi:transposase
LSYLKNAEEEIRALVVEHPDATLVKLCELFAQKTENWVSKTAMCRCAAEIRTQSKKKHGTAAKPPQKESKN